MFRLMPNPVSETPNQNGYPVGANGRLPLQIGGVQIGFGIRPHGSKSVRLYAQHENCYRDEASPTRGRGSPSINVFLWAVARVEPFAQTSPRQRDDLSRLQGVITGQRILDMVHLRRTIGWLW